MIDRQAAHVRVDEILNDHLPSMMGRNGVDVSLKEFVDQVIDQAYLKGVADERGNMTLEQTTIAKASTPNFQPADYPSAKERRRTVDDATQTG